MNSYHEIRPLLASLAASHLGPKDDSEFCSEDPPRSLLENRLDRGQISLCASNRMTFLPLTDNEILEALKLKNNENFTDFQSFMKYERGLISEAQRACIMKDAAYENEYIAVLSEQLSQTTSQYPKFSSSLPCFIRYSRSRMCCSAHENLIYCIDQESYLGHQN